MTWRPARSLTTFHAQVQREHPAAAPPATPADAWGLIGDAAHDPTSDHAPKDFPGWGTDIVTAADTPHAPALGLDIGAVFEAVRVSRDNRIKYMIFNDRICSSYATASRAAWAWGPYNPNDPNRDRHRTHGHLSVVGDARADDTRPWATGGREDTTMRCVYGETSDNVGTLQQFLTGVGLDPGPVDRHYGDKTAAAVRAALQPEDMTNTGRTVDYWVEGALLTRVLLKRAVALVLASGGGGVPIPGPAGPPGPPGPKGDAAVLPANAVLTITAS